MSSDNNLNFSTDGTKRFESDAWKPIRGIWRPLFGGFFDRGVSVEFSEFLVDNPLDWSRSFHPESIEICLNFAGNAEFGSGKSSKGATAGELLAYFGNKTSAQREPGSMHRFFTVELSADFLRKEFASMLDNIAPEVRRFLEDPSRPHGLVNRLALPANLLSLRLHLIEPPVFTSAHEIWYHSKILEILAQTLFAENRPAELFCHQHHRVNRERIERARYLIERDIENPPTLEMLATELGCSTFYLSRLFAQEAGMSIPKFLRMCRMTKAAELLRESKMSVTEVAMAVGYSSLSAFNKAFLDQFGCCPGLYPVLGRPMRQDVG